MSDKIRIHELAKRYGLSGKDCAAKLRDFGFSKARSHMTALDEFEAMQASGLLEANGIEPVAASGAAQEASVGGVKVKKKLKKKTAEAVDGPETTTTEPLPATTPAVPPIEDAAPQGAEPGGTTAPEHGPSEHGARSAEIAEEAPRESSNRESATIPDAPLESAQGAGGEATATVESDASAETTPAGGVSTGTEGAEASPTTPGEEAPEAGAPAEEVPSSESEPSGSEPLSGETGREVGGEVSTEPAENAAASPEAMEEGAAPKTEEAAPQPEAPKKRPGPKGKITGFIDPSKLQQAQPRRRSESRRLKSRDDATPDVRPTFTGRGGRSGGQSAGRKLTAAQLREREQGRFLRRQGRRSSTGRGGRRGGGGSRPHQDVTESPLKDTTVVIEAPITISKLAEALKLKVNVVIKKAMFSQLGMFTSNALLDDDTAALIADEFDVTLDIRHEISAEEQHLEALKRKRDEIDEDDLVMRAPTVAFLGHVDHGKTTLIDKIRSTRVAEGESGGITQHIGAYQVQTEQGHTITIVDTPGHEAFTAMRARGAKAVDIVVLVVAGDDGVKPSTVEAINHARAAGTPIVVALNKKDKPGFNANQVIQQLMGHELVPEAYSGTTAFFETSGITGEGIEDLLEHIFLMGEAEIDLRASGSGPASGVVLEAQVEQGRGVVAHLLIQDGTLLRGDVILAGEGYGKVKSIHDDRGNQLQNAGPSMPVEVTGLAALPGVGDPFYVVESLDKAKEIAQERERKNRAMALAAGRGQNRELERILGSKPKKELAVINLIVRADVQGSAEVLRHEIEKLKHEEVEVKLVHVGVGPITESDVNLASTSGAILVAFHVGVNTKARKEAERFGLDIRRYDVIYELLDDLRNAMEGALSPEFREEVTGHAEIKRIFKSSKIGLIAGCMVLDGKVRRSSKIRLLRDGTVVHTGEIASLRRESEDVREVREGFECGIVLRDYRDIREGDIIEAYTLKEVRRSLGDF